MIINIDFDGTIVEHRYPDIGNGVPGAISVITQLWLEGHKLILWTMRSGEELDAAVDYLNGYGVPLYGVNENPDQWSWTESPKAYAHITIDDSALGCPLRPSMNSKRPMVDWSVVEQMLIDQGVLSGEPYIKGKDYGNE